MADARLVPAVTALARALARIGARHMLIDRASKGRIGRRSVPVAIPDDLVVYKAIAARERDRADVARLLELHGKSMALERVRALVRELADALERPELLHDLDTIIRQQQSRNNRAKASKKARRRK